MVLGPFSRGITDKRSEGELKEVESKEQHDLRPWNYSYKDNGNYKMIATLHRKV